MGNIERVFNYGELVAALGNFLGSWHQFCHMRPVYCILVRPVVSSVLKVICGFDNLKRGYLILSCSCFHYFHVTSMSSFSSTSTSSSTSYKSVSQKSTATVFPSSVTRTTGTQYSIPTSSRTPPSLKPPTRTSTSSVSSSRLLYLV